MASTKTECKTPFFQSSYVKKATAEIKTKQKCRKLLQRRSKYIGETLKDQYIDKCKCGKWKQLNYAMCYVCNGSSYICHKCNKLLKCTTGIHYRTCWDCSGMTKCKCGKWRKREFRSCYTCWTSR